MKKILMMCAVALVMMGAWAEYTDDCITFSSTASFTLRTYNWSKNWNGTLWTSADKKNWAEWTGDEVSAVKTGSNYQLHVRGDANNTKISGLDVSYSTRWCLRGIANIACSGNIETLRGATGTEPSLAAMNSHCYWGLFCGCTSLTTAPTLPATSVPYSGYHGMFSGCTSLTTAPELPATTLELFCYGDMFSGCTSLTNAPALPATTLAYACYEGMFYGCTSLTMAPELPATKLADGCYEDMFKGCTSLTTTPELPATQLAEWCYSQMFYGCTSLTTTPELPATQLASQCYSGMFSRCTSLTTARDLSAMTLAERCCYQMFYGCTSLTTAPKLPATKLSNYCYEDMFNGCTSLTTPPDLPATQLADGCYFQMFDGCTSLTMAPTLPAKTLKRICYDCMFYGCTSLTTAPMLPATTLAEGCYCYMFWNCTSLITVPELPATTLATSCYQSMFLGCTSLEINNTAPGVEWKIPATIGASYWGADMFTRTVGTLQGQPALNTTYYIKSAPLPGSKVNPWQIGADAGDEVIAWTNGVGKLIVEGAGNMKEFAADGSDIPWPMAEISAVEISIDVTGIGYNVWYGLDDSVTYNGLSIGAAKTLINGFKCKQGLLMMIK